ncbi:hypothetical protein B0I35DRAFT_480788 [Stachybotrys elegans]|uniref:Uncharacterized protein n=1 Tax=Stachybotrys elegans TaxID=80388 RepID=A0A8K0SQK4_9HYPO|nr:hypothetical protein B0I35DRAFT_480788 [Stachybotrys elegans]
MSSPSPGNEGSPRTTLAQIEQQRQALIRNAQQRLKIYEAQYGQDIHRRVKNIVANRSLGLAEFLLFNTTSPPKMILRKSAEIRCLNMGMHAGRALTDEEMRLIVDFCQSELETKSYTGAAAVLGAMAIEFRGRRKGRFPFFQPKYRPAWHPETAEWPRSWILPVVRGVAYYTLFSVLVVPPLDISIIRGQWLSLLADRRMASIRQAMQRTIQSNEATLRQPTEDPVSQWQEKPDWPETPAPNAPQSYQEQPSPPRAPANPPPVQGRNDEDPFVSDSFMDDDDASPIAPGARNRPTSSNAGTTWEDIRRRALGGRVPQNPQASQDSSQAGSGSSWGGDAGTSPEYRGGSESFSYSKADEEKETPKSQAQKEFDELIERERRNAGQDGSWGRK